MSGSMGSINAINAVRTSKLINTLNKSQQVPDKANLDNKADKHKSKWHQALEDNKKASLSAATSLFTMQRRTASTQGFVPVNVPTRVPGEATIAMPAVQHQIMVVIKAGTAQGELYWRSITCETSQWQQ